MRSDGKRARAMEAARFAKTGLTAAERREAVIRERHARGEHIKLCQRKEFNLPEKPTT